MKEISASNGSKEDEKKGDHGVILNTINFFFFFFPFFQFSAANGAERGVVPKMNI